MSPIISREASNDQFEKYFLELGNRSEKIIDYSNQVFDWIMEKAINGDDDIPVTLLFRQSIEILDSMTILFKAHLLNLVKYYFDLY